MRLKIKNMTQKNNFKNSKFSKRKLIRGVAYALIAGAVWFAQQQGWLNNNAGNQQQVTNNSSSQDVNKKSNVQVSKPVSTNGSSTQRNDNALIAQLYKQGRSDEIVTAVGRVGKILPDDNKGSRHQKFLLDIGQKKWLLVAHNIDLAPYVPLREGDDVIVHGEYEFNEKGGVLHWTHHDPRGYHEEGYIEHNGKKYK